MNQERNILRNIEATFAAEIQPGGDLEGIRSYYVLYTASDLPPEYGSRAPVAVARMLPLGIDSEISIPNCMIEKVCPVAFSVYTQNAGDTRNDEASQILDKIENTFEGNGFGISDWVWLAEKNFTGVSLPPFAGDYTGAGELVINYSYVDMKGIPVNTPLLISPDLLLTETSTIPNYYDIVRIYGAVTLISTPTIAPGRYDGQLLTIQGVDDSQIPTLQDEGDLPGSGLHMQGRRSFNFGINDSMDFRWNMNQAIWVDQRRADVY